MFTEVQRRFIRTYDSGQNLYSMREKESVADTRIHIATGQLLLPFGKWANFVLVLIPLIYCWSFVFTGLYASGISIAV
jgi:hypothetical protein